MWREFAGGGLQDARRHSRLPHEAARKEAVRDRQRAKLPCSGAKGIFGMREMARYTPTAR